MTRADAIEHDGTGRYRDGWYNFCDCGARYWTRSSDITRTRARRFEQRDSEVQHKCAFYPRPTKAEPEEGNSDD